MSWDRDPSPGWRQTELVAEGLGNLRAWRSRAFVVLVAAVALGATCGWFLAQGNNRFRQEQVLARATGSTVVRLGDPAEATTTFSRASCEGLTQLQAVDAAGTVDLGGYGTTVQTGLTAIASVSPSLVAFPTGVDVVLGASIVEERGLPATGNLALEDGTVVSYATGQRQPEGVDINRSLALPRWPTARVRSCLVVLDSSAEPVDMLPTLLATLDVHGGAVVPAQAPSIPDTSVGRYLARTDGFVVLMVGAFVGTVGGLLRRFRVSDAVRYRFGGMSRGELLFLAAIEESICGASFAAAGTAVLVPAGTDPTLAAASSWWLVAAGALGTTLAISWALLVVLPSPLSLAKDR